MRALRWIARSHGLTTVVALSLAAPALAATTDDFATLEAASGRVSVIRLGQPQPLAPSMPLRQNDIVVTREGRASVRFIADGTVIRIGPDSRVQIDESAKERDITVFFGQLWAHVVRFKERTTRFRSSSTIAAIRGTEISMGVAVDGDQTQLSVLEGHVEAETDSGKLALAGGQVAVGQKGKAPSLSTKVKPQDAVSWALYYLPVISPKAGDVGASVPGQAKVRDSAEAYAKGDLSRALESLEGFDARDVKDPRFFTYRASLLLATGSVDAARRDLEQALKLAPNDAEALAQRAIMAVAANQADLAVDTAKQAVAAGPKSAFGPRRPVLRPPGQVRPGRGPGEPGDRGTGRARRCAGLGPAGRDPLVARATVGKRSQAAQKAVALNPNLSRTQSVLGYPYLTQVKTREAREAFAKAIALDGGDPLPRLGLGLAQIREGHLAEGTQGDRGGGEPRPRAGPRAELPGQGLLRSEAGPLSTRGSTTWRRPRTPRTRPRCSTRPSPSRPATEPVEALKDIQQAIELNDNRAVYRSRLLLDQDLAARSASLGRIYSDLGFQDLALVEGWSSVNTDPGNYSAHRLLADSYAALPRHEIARVSELFQSQMLQPLNTTPIQPRLGESNLFLISSQGPSALAFNEFNPLFNRNQVNAQGSFLAGEDRP